MEDEEDVRHRSASVNVPAPSVSVRRMTLHVLSVEHMAAAARFSREVEALEKTRDTSAVVHLSSACVFMAFASLEAYANEVFFDRQFVFLKHKPELIGAIWKFFEDKPTLEKFDFALVLLEAKPFDKGAAPYQDVVALSKLRNSLMHFKSEWENSRKTHKTVTELLRGKFKVPKAGKQHDPDFPSRWACHNCTKWVVESCLAYAREFERLSHLAPQYDSSVGRLSP